MQVPTILNSKLDELGRGCGVALRIVKHWKNEFRDAWICWYRGEVINTELLRIEIAGTLAVELENDREDEVDLFVFVNGVRTGKMKKPFEYLCRYGNDSFKWVYDDPGFDQFDSLEYFDELEQR